MRQRAVVVREFEAGDEREVLAAFNRTNADLDPNFQTRDLDEWRWRYEKNPAGRRLTLALDEEQRVLAQYAGSPQRLRLDGVPVCVTQGIDSFSVPETRGLGRRGSFVQAGELFAATYGGRTSEGDPWMWGFPVPTARRVGQRFLGYEVMRSQPILEWTHTRAVPSGRRAEDLGEEPLDAHAHELQEFFMHRSEGPWVLADRRARALQWRYREHPGRTYRVGLARSTGGELRGWAVLRIGAFEGTPACLVCDWLAEPEVEGDLVRWAIEWAEAAGVRRVVHLLPPGCDSFRSLQELGFRVRPSSLVLVGRSYDGAYPAAFWAERWYYTLGDTDLV